MQFIQEDRSGIELLIDKLIPLSAVSVAGQLAMRPLDRAHVEILMCSDPRSWDPIQVTRTDKGYCYYDGQHRIHASLGNDITSIIADCKSFTSEQDLVDAAFQANLHHGLPATDAYRSNYVFYLYRIHGDRVTQQWIADKAGINQGRVSKIIAKREKQLALAHQNGAEAQKEELGQITKQFLKVAKKFYEVASTEDYEGLVQELHDLAKKTEDRDAFYFAGQLLLDATKPPAFVKSPSSPTL